MLVEDRRLVGVWALSRSISVSKGSRGYHTYLNHVQLLETND